MIPLTLLFMGLSAVLVFTSCKKDDEDPEPEGIVASFQYEVSATNFAEVTFTNFSQNASSYEWDFGDGNTSTEKDPVHTYAAEGTYTVELTASNADGSDTYSQEITLEDPNTALAKLAGTDSKTWKLFREGTSMGVGPDETQPRIWWALENDGSRPCVYYHEFTFARDGSFTFDDMGSFWGEAAVFGGTAQNEICFDAIASNMVNSNGDDVSAWLSGTHAFDYDPVAGTITLNGTGAWMGLPQLGTNGESITPEATKTFSASIEEKTGYDLLHIAYSYPSEGLYWDFTYASYSDPSLEPDVVQEQQPYGTDLPDFTPTDLYNTFNSTSATDVQDLFPTDSISDVTITAGIDDPANPSGTVKVGEYIRGTQLYADLKFALDYDIQFDNFDSLSIDVYIPSSNTYSSGGLTKGIQIWIADYSQTENFWESWVQYDVDPSNVVEDQWQTFTFALESPSAGTGTPGTRTDLDMVGLVIGGANHAVDGTFYVRDFMFH